MNSNIAANISRPKDTRSKGTLNQSKVNDEGARTLGDRRLLRRNLTATKSRQEEQKSIIPSESPSLSLYLQGTIQHISEFYWGRQISSHRRKEGPANARFPHVGLTIIDKTIMVLSNTLSILRLVHSNESVIGLAHSKGPMNVLPSSQCRTMLKRLLNARCFPFRTFRDTFRNDWQIFCLIFLANDLLLLFELRSAFQWWMLSVINKINNTINKKTRKVTSTRQ